VKLNVRQVASEKICAARWGCEPNGKRFRCYLCGYKITPGDGFILHISPRMNGEILPNFISCDLCRQTSNILHKWKAAVDEAKVRFWWLWEK